MASPHEHLEWDRLIIQLNSWASAVALGRERIRVVLPGEAHESRDLEIIMSPDDWSCIYGVAYGDVTEATTYVRRALEGLPSEHGFLVYDCYELHPSATATLPEHAEEARFEELLLKHPGLQGNWVAYTSDGVAHPFPEPPPVG